MLVPLRLTAGQAWAAWRRWPALRRELAAPRPGPPILVTGAYRTGTTWVGAMLAAAGLWPTHEPFNPNRRLWPEELAYAPGGEPRPEIDALVAALLRGGHREVVRLAYADRWFSPLRLLPLAPGRVLVKDPSAALLTEYLVRRHRMRAVVLYRHPAAVVASYVRLGWPTGALVGRLLASPALMEEWLAPHAARMEAAAGRRDWTSGAVFYAALATALLGIEGRNSGATIRLSFEDLCADPVARFRELHARLGLPYHPGVTRAHERLTQGGDAALVERPHGVRRRSARMAGRWRSEVAPSDAVAVREAWEAFDLPLYREPADWPERPEAP
ncbi:MAG TPA: sulfotransferase [Longimicrobiales bacterium]|nr:sulfotransferase [Longimicrobiales bacterium]